ncbi:MAG: hypothetical protein ACREUD_00955 [Gammaproteobacteria bacterium]
MSSTMNGVGKLACPERNYFFYGKLMDADQFQKDQFYFNHKRSLVNRLVLGSGLVCGLSIVQDTEAGGMLRIEPGLAIDGSGREIVVSAPVLVDPRQLTNDQGEPEGTPIDAGFVEIRLAYAETKADLVPVLVPDCDTYGNCAPSTIREGFRVLVRQTTDEIPRPPGCNFPLQSPPAEAPPRELLQLLLCERTREKCSELPTDASVPLGRVRIENEAISSIDPCVGRQLVYSNALLYELILCLAERVQALSSGT